MIALVLAQLAARWGQAVTLLLLSAAATVAAVGVPVYTDSVDRAAVENERAAAEPGELIVSSVPLSGTLTDPPEELATFAALRSELADFEPVTTVDILVMNEQLLVRRMVAQDGFCAHVSFQAGRCPVGSREVALPATLADESGFRVGDLPELTPVIPVAEGAYRPDGPPVGLTVVGVFVPRDTADPYWRAALDPLGLVTDQPAVFTNRTALSTILHNVESTHVDAVLPRDRLTLERIPALREQLDRAERRLAAEDVTDIGSVNTRLPDLLDRIVDHGDDARALLPIAVAPLLALCWFVVYLAVGHGVAARRYEVGVVALRGVRPHTRAIAVATECLAPLLAGAVVGLVVTGGFAIDGEELQSAGIAAAGTAAAALIALRAELTAPVVQLLRRVPPRRRAATVAVEVLAAALAAAAMLELHGLDGELVGAMVAAPAAVMLAVALLVARAVLPVSDLIGRWALRRGRLAPAVAALSLARRPGAARLLVVLALVLGLAGFAVTSADVAAAGRTTESQRAFGADRVLTIEEADRGELLQAVRAADPSGEYAMAVVAAPPGASDAPTVVALDATRLAQVARWSTRYGDIGPTEVAALLRPPAREPVLIGDGTLAAELSLGEIPPGGLDGLDDPDGVVTATLVLIPPTGLQAAARFGPLTRDQQTYAAEVRGCPDGCRLAGIVFNATQETYIDVTLRALRLDGVEVAPADWRTDADRWRSPERGDAFENLEAVVTADGLILSVPFAEPGESYEILALDVPYPLPVVGAGALPELVTGIDNQLVRIDQRAGLTGVPGAGNTGILMDLEYAERLAIRPGDAAQPRVWLTADAPPEVVDRLREQGLVITDDRSIDSARAAIDDSGAALALRFYLLAVGLAVLVGLGALVLVTAVDRRTWRRSLRELRGQGLAERTTTAAALWSYGGIVLAGAVAGGLAAVAAWLGTGEWLPLGVEESALSRWPQWTVVFGAWLAVVVALLAAAVVAGARRVRD